MIKSCGHWGWCACQMQIKATYLLINTIHNQVIYALGLVCLSDANKGYLLTYLLTQFIIKTFMHWGWCACQMQIKATYLLIKTIHNQVIYALGLVCLSDANKGYLLTYLLTQFIIKSFMHWGWCACQMQIKATYLLTY